MKRFFLLMLFLCFVENISSKLVKASDFQTRHPYWDGDLKINAPRGTYEANLNNRNVFLTDKLVYKKNEPIILYSLSSKKSYFEVVNPFKSKVIKTGQISNNSTEKSKQITFNLNKGINLKGYEFTIIQPIQSDSGWLNINVKNENRTDTFQSIPIYIEPEITKSDILFVDPTDTVRGYVTFYPFWSYYQIPHWHGDIFFRPHTYPADRKIRNFNSIKDTKEQFMLACKQHLINPDGYIKKNLSNWGIKFDSMSDDYFDDYANISQYKTIIFGAHNEFWTMSKILNLKKFIDSGGKVIILGGNAAWRSVARVEDGIYIWGDGILKNKWNSGNADSIYAQDKNIKINFLKNYLGIYYDANGAYTSAPFVYKRTKFLKEFTDAKPGSLFGKKSDFPVGNKKTCSGASGHETDKLFPGANGFTILARGKNPKGSGGQIAYKKFKSGGEMFNMGSLNSWMFLNDPEIKKLILHHIKN